MATKHRNARLSKAERSRKFTSKRVRSIQAAKNDRTYLIGSYSPVKYDFSYQTSFVPKPAGASEVASLTIKLQAANTRIAELEKTIVTVVTRLA